MKEGLLPQSTLKQNFFFAYTYFTSIFHWLQGLLGTFFVMSQNPVAVGESFRLLGGPSQIPASPITSLVLGHAVIGHHQ